MNVLRITSCMAENAEPLCQGIAGYLHDRLGVPTELVDEVHWTERERQLDAGAIDLAWICGLPYVWKADSGEPSVEIVAAPVMTGPRYRGLPIYFSDVVVRSDSPYGSFADLRGASWTFNERRSHSGYNLVRYHLARIGDGERFFGRVVESGAHQRSLEMILDGGVDASAIDSTVLELEVARRPEIASRLRLLDTLGPSPIPPWVVHSSTEPRLRRAIRECLLAMHEDVRGRAILEQGRCARFTSVSDRDYDPVREMARVAETVAL